MEEAYRLLRRIKERVLLRLVFVLGEDRRVFSCVRSPRRINRVDIFYYEIVPLFFVALQRRFTRRARAFASCQTGIAYIGFLCYFVAEEREREREREVGWRVCGVTSTRGLI